MTFQGDFPVKEFDITVPWGHVSVKTWGNEKDFPVVALHGILDNCSTFDRLILLLPRSFYYVTFDLPGHGKSSHFHDGLPLDFFNYILSVRYVVDRLKLFKFCLIGHSLGAQLSIFFSSLYPERVVKLLCLDGIVPEPIPLEKTVQRIRKRLDNIYNGPKGKIPPSYSFEQAFERLLKNRHSQLTEEAAQVLIKRAITPSSSGYRFSADQRLKGYWRIPMTLEQIQAFVLEVKCPLLLIMARETYNKFEPIYGEGYIDRLESLIYGTVDIKIVTVEGNHDVHLNHPERVLKHVLPFLLELKSKL